MMRFLLVLFIALSVGIGLTFLGEKPGYVLITREPWAIETTFSFFIIVLLALLALSYFFLRVLFYLFSTPERVRKWNRLRSRAQAFENIRVGLTDAINGNWQHAQKLLTRPSDSNPMPEIGFAVAAWIAQQQNNHEQRDDYLAEAGKVDGSESTVGIVKSYLQKQAGQLEQALATAQLLHEKSKSNPVVLRLLIDLMHETKQWEDLYDLLSRSAANEILPDHERDELMNNAAARLLASSADRQETEAHWKGFAKKTRKQPAVIASYCRMLNHFSAADDAEALIRNTLKETWSEELVEIYGLLATSDPASQLKQAEQWTKDHPDNTALMLALGRLSINNSLWGMARSYLQVAVQNGDQAEAFLALARLYESLGEIEKAQDIYKQGLELSVTGRSASPARSHGKAVGREKGAAIEADSSIQSPSLAYSNESK